MHHTAGNNIGKMYTNIWNLVTMSISKLPLAVDFKFVDLGSLQLLIKIIIQIWAKWVLSKGQISLHITLLTHSTFAYS